MLDGVLSAVAAVVAPPRCAACGSECSGERSICSVCERALGCAQPIREPGPPGLDLACAAGPYEDVVRDLVLGLKFRRLLPLAGVAAAAIERICPRELLEGALVPVPAAPLRWRWRGFDPAEEIALALSEVTGLELRPCLRREQGPRQMGRPRSTRLSTGPRVRVAADAPGRALLVDDVHTTGATLSACARALRSGGCREVVALTLARA